MYDVIIIGGGPAGIAGGVYAARKHLKALFITKDFGGQSVVSGDIQNWIGDPHIPGNDLAKKLEAHLREYAGNLVKIHAGVLATKVEKMDGGFRVTTDDGATAEGRAVLLAVGAGRRRLSVPGADALEHKGVTYCASCDGPLFSDMDVAVIGGGNAGFETALQLLAYVKSVTLLHSRESFKADPVTVENALKHPHMRAITNVETLEIKGDTLVSGLVYKDTKTGETHELPISGVFVEIGILPNTAIVEGLVELDNVKRVVVDPKNQRTSVAGIWAAGDCTNELYHQNNIAAGDGVKALEDIYVWLKTR